MKKNLKILSEPVAITDGEIADYMDFQKVLEKFEQPAVSFPFKSLAGLILIILIATTFFVWRQSVQNDTQELKTNEKPSSIEDDSIGTIMNRANPEKTDTPKEVDGEEFMNQEMTPESSVLKGSPEEANTEERATGKKSVETNSDEEAVAPDATPPGEEMLFVKAEPQVGLTRLYEYFEDHLQYPEEVADSDISGQTLVTFTIFRDGSVGDIVFEKSLGRAFDKQVILVLENMPPWNPATINGKAVDSKISIPLYFTKP